MLLLSSKRVDNVVTMRVRATSTHAAEISFLICEQMEKTRFWLSPSPGAPPSAPRIWVERTCSNPSIKLKLIWTLNSRFDMSDGSGGGVRTLCTRGPTMSRI